MNCPKCNEQLADSSLFCNKCGFNLTEGAQAQNATENAPTEKKKKGNTKALISVIAAVVVVVVAVVSVIAAMPLIRYNSANKAFESKEYEKAISLYAKVIDYKDSEAKIDESYLGYGIQLAQDGKYEEAIEALNKAKPADEETKEKYISYTNAAISVEAEDLQENTISVLEKFGSFENSKELLNKAYYIKGNMLAAKESYNEAIGYYKKTTGFKDVDKKIADCETGIQNQTFMKAETYFKDGELDKALPIYKSLPKDFKYNGVKVSARLKTLDKHKDLVKLCGSWYGTDGKMSVRQTYDRTGSWDQWDATYSDNMTVKCIINDDGTFTIKGEAHYYIYTNYSTISAGLKTLNAVRIFSYTGNKIPEAVYNSGNVKVTYSNGKFRLEYDLNDPNYSVNFTYRYKSSITYKKS